MQFAFNAASANVNNPASKLEEQQEQNGAEQQELNPNNSGQNVNQLNAESQQTFQELQGGALCNTGKLVLII